MGDEGWGDLQKQRLAEKVNGQTADDTTPARVAAAAEAWDETIAEAIEQALSHNLADALEWDWDEEPPNVPSVKDALADPIAALVPTLTAAVVAALDAQPGDTEQAGGLTDDEQPDFRAAIIRGLEVRFKAVLAACELAEAEARHVVDDEVYVSVGLIRNALRITTPASGGPDDGAAERDGT